MRLRSVVTLVVAALAAVSAAVLGQGEVLAGKKPYEDKKLGFRLRIEDWYVQNPPKLTGDEAFIVGDWYEDAAKFDQGNLRPTFQMMWFVDPKNTAPAKAPEPAAGGLPSREEIEKEMRASFRSSSFEEQIDRVLSINVRLFGEAIPLKDRWAEAKKDKTAGKVPIPFEYVEINKPSKKKKAGEPDPEGYVYLAKFDLDRPNETIHVGFFGSCGVAYCNRFEKEFPAMVRSFEELKSASDSRNEAAQQDLAQDPKARREQIRKTKAINGWKSMDTTNYILLYHEDVDPKMVKSIGEQIEAIRAQIYEVLFVPDRPVTAVSIVRVCKDRDQYMGYGAPGGSAGYWDKYSEELVFYEDQNMKTDSLRVLYHEAFHQFIHYSVGEMDPHSWFNEGHGDYFFGFDYVGGRFKRNISRWRLDEARTAKKNPKRPPLREWINWTQAQYYGSNKEGIDIGSNYAMGWSLVYFLRTTKKPEYQGVCDRYFNSLKSSVTRAMNADAEWEKKMKEWQEKVKEDPAIPPPERGATSDRGDATQWLTNAVADAFKGIDWDAIEKDWLAAEY